VSTEVVRPAAVSLDGFLEDLRELVEC